MPKNPHYKMRVRLKEKIIDLMFKNFGNCPKKLPNQILELVSKNITQVLVSKDAVKNLWNKMKVKTLPEQEVLEEIKKFKIKPLAGVTDENERFLECNRRASYISKWQSKLK